MARAGFAALALALAGCAAAPAPQAPAAAAQALVVRNAGFEEPLAPGGHCAPGWDCTMHAGPTAFRYFADETHPAAGARSFCLEPASKEPWGVLSQGRFDVVPLRGARIRYSAAVRLDAVQGQGAGLFVVAHGGAGNVVAATEHMDTGTRDWTRASVELEVPATAFALEYGLSLTGTGRACLDDVRLEVLRPAPGAV